MDSLSRNAFAAVAVKAKLAFYPATVFAFLLVLAGNGYAATPTAASLNGAYVFHLSITKEAQWSTTKECTYKGVSSTYWAGGQSAYTELSYGTMTFNGKGSVTVAMTDSHRLNQSASNATATITCNSNGTANTTGGNMVYEAPSTGTVVGTYTVNAEGIATITLPDGLGSLEAGLSLFTGTGLSTTLLLRSMDSNIGTGLAIHK